VEREGEVGELWERSLWLRVVAGLVITLATALALRLLAGLT